MQAEGGQEALASMDAFRPWDYPAVQPDGLYKNLVERSQWVFQMSLPLLNEVMAGREAVPEEATQVGTNHGLEIQTDQRRTKTIGHLEECNRLQKKKLDVGLGLGIEAEHEAVVSWHDDLVTERTEVELR